MTIPKLIHQIWFQGEENIPSKLKEYHSTWILHNPTYKIKVWDEKSIDQVLIEYNDEETTEMYNNYKHMIQKIDLAKYIILYIYGGIYIDMDMKCLKPLTDDFIGDNDVILCEMISELYFTYLFIPSGYDINSKLINNGIIMTSPKHPILLYTIEQAKKNKDSITSYISKTIYVYASTGPLCLTLATNKYNSENGPSKIKIVDKKYFEGCDVIELKYNNCKIPDEAIGIHLYENSLVDTFDNIVLSIMSFIIFYRYIFLFIIISCIVFYFIKPNKLLKSVKSKKIR